MPEKRPTYGDKRRPWHQEFIEYMYSIVDHPAYQGMPCTTDAAGKIDWSIPSNRSRGAKNWDGNRRRKQWWSEKAVEVGIERRGKWISKLAKRIHPTGRKPCQTCGRILELAYVYPRSRTIDTLNRRLPSQDHLTYDDLLTVYEVVDHFYAVLGRHAAPAALADVFTGLPANASDGGAKEYIRAAFVDKESRKLSPGAMSNAPDRLDGFHSYNLCCRGKQDRGRAKDNLRTYSDDRRAFEHWCEGDWVSANFLMTHTTSGECASPVCDATDQLTADHIGPISLGFSHSPHFEPLCRACNSAKNNRMSLRDVRLLLAREQCGEPVASWQAQPLWRSCSLAVSSDEDALLLSKLLRINQHHYLTHLHEAVAADVPDVLLQFLAPEYALRKVDFVSLDRQTLKYERIEVKPRNDTYAHSKACRMVRIAYDALQDYVRKDKRNVQEVATDSVQKAHKRYRAALRRAAAEPSTIRQGLVRAIQSDDRPETRASQINRLLNGRYKPNVDYSYIREALNELMVAYAVVLGDRFERGEAVSWDD